MVDTYQQANKLTQLDSPVLDVNFWEDIFYKFLRLAKEDTWLPSGKQAVSGNPKWDSHLNVIGIRRNALEHFYRHGGEEAFNDHLVLVEPLRSSVTVIPCTVDPAVVRVNKLGIAHLWEGLWESYVRGWHRLPWRKCLKQVRDVPVMRTDSKGIVVQKYIEHWGPWGIQVHNPGSLIKTSAGCTVTQPDPKPGRKDKNFQLFKEILARAEDIPLRTYTLMNSIQLANMMENE